MKKLFKHLNFSSAALFFLVILNASLVYSAEEIDPRLPAINQGAKVDGGLEVFAGAEDLDAISVIDGKWTIEVDDELVSLILNEVIRLSDVPIVLLDELPEDLRLSLNVKDVPLDKLVESVVAEQGYGGYAIYRDADGVITSIYIVTKIGVDSISRRTDDILSRVQ